MNKQLKRKMHMIALFWQRGGWRKALYIKNHNIFHRIGEKCYYHPYKLPAEPFLVSLGNNVFIGTGVNLITHNMANCVFKNMLKNDDAPLDPIVGKIEIGNNVFIGASSTILYNVKIGNECIVAAGSVVTKNVPDGSVVAGVPAKVIGSFSEQRKKCIDFNEQLKKVTDNIDGDLWDKYASYFYNNG